jgi:hypothetical protein
MRWISPVILAALFITSWVLVFIGGMVGAWSWVIITGIWPLVAIVVMISFLIVSLVKRRVTAPRLFSATLAVPMVWPLLWGLGIGAIAYPSSTDHVRPALTVRSPSNSPLKVVWGGNSARTNYHAATPGQRWAYDLVVAPAGSGASDLKAYGCYGTPVVAPIGGKVHMAFDGQPDQAIGTTLTDLDKLLGNYVVIKPEATGTYLIVAHLKPGSVTVSSGQTVKEGDVIGACGNSGNTSEPHIHIHHQRQDPMLYDGKLNLGVNIVEGLPLYFRTAKGEIMPKGGVDVRDGKVVFIGDVLEP